MSDLDIATGMLLGARTRAQPMCEPDLAPLAALEREILPALLRPPCLVSFSGGRDSSAVLAVATALARREGLDLPIPATNEFADAVHAEEREWQERVIGHLGIEDWMRMEHGAELDLLGPYAKRVMRRHGLLWPCNVHFHLPLLDAASGGSLLTGIGGDELFAAARRPRPLRTGDLRRLPRDAARVAFARSPGALRRAVTRMRERLDLPWLRPTARRALAAVAAVETVGEPRRPWPRVAWWRALRYLNEGMSGLDLTARDADVMLVHPLLAERYWAAVGRLAGPHGFENRAQGMRALFGGVLPLETITRRSKAHFDEAMWSESARAFAARWDGSGVPSAWVDEEALFRHWNSPNPLAQSFTLLQAAWLHSATDCVEERAHGLLV